MKELRHHPNSSLSSTILLWVYSPLASNIRTSFALSQTFPTTLSFKTSKQTNKIQFQRNLTGFQFLSDSISAKNFLTGTSLHSDLMPCYLAWYSRLSRIWPQISHRYKFSTAIPAHFIFQKVTSAGSWTAGCFKNQTFKISYTKRIG